MQPSDIHTADAPPADAPPPMSDLRTVPDTSSTFQIVSAEEIASKAAQAESTAAPPRKKRKVKSAAANVTAPVHANAPAPSSSAPPPAPMVPGPVHQPLPPAHEYPPPPPPPPPFSADVPPLPPPGAPYPPYYMTPYGMQPYGGQPPPYPYSHYSPHYHQYPHPPYGYQPPYPPYSQPYPYPPYGQQPYAPPPYPAGGPPPPPPPQPPPPVQGTYSVSSDFVSRADYAAASQSVQQTQTPRAAPHYATFSAKTGEPHNRVSSVPSALRKKRPLEGEGVFYAGEHAPPSSGQSTPASVPPPAAAAASGEAPSDGPVDPDGPTIDAAAQAVRSLMLTHRSSARLTGAVFCPGMREPEMPPATACPPQWQPLRAVPGAPEEALGEGEASFQARAPEVCREGGRELDAGRVWYCRRLRRRPFVRWSLSNLPGASPLVGKRDGVVDAHSGNSRTTGIIITICVLSVALMTLLICPSRYCSNAYCAMARLQYVYG